MKPHLSLWLKLHCLSLSLKTNISYYYWQTPSLIILKHHHGRTTIFHYHWGTAIFHFHWQTLLLIVMKDQYLLSLKNKHLSVSLKTQISYHWKTPVSHSHCGAPSLISIDKPYLSSLKNLIIHYLRATLSCCSYPYQEKSMPSTSVTSLTNRQSSTLTLPVPSVCSLYSSTTSADRDRPLCIQTALRPASR